MSEINKRSPIYSTSQWRDGHPLSSSVRKALDAFDLLDQRDGYGRRYVAKGEKVSVRYEEPFWVAQTPDGDARFTSFSSAVSWVEKHCVDSPLSLLAVSVSFDEQFKRWIIGRGVFPDEYRDITSREAFEIGEKMAKDERCQFVVYGDDDRVTHYEDFSK